KFRQAVADFHDRQVSRHVGDRNAEQGGSLELRENFDLLFAFGRRKAIQPALQLGEHILARQRRGIQARVEQLVQQKWITCYLFGEPGAGLAKVDEPVEDDRVLVEQGDVGAAAN